MKKIIVKTEYVNGLPIVSYEVGQEDDPYQIIETTDEDEMLHRIMAEVDKSSEKCTFNYVGINKNHQFEVPSITLNKSSYYWDNESKDKGLFTLIRIIRRPENPDDENNTDYVYDIEMEQNGCMMIESIECVGIQILCAIYSFISGNK